MTVELKMFTDDQGQRPRLWGKVDCEKGHTVCNRTWSLEKLQSWPKSPGRQG